VLLADRRAGDDGGDAPAPALPDMLAALDAHDREEESDEPAGRQTEGGSHGDDDDDGDAAAAMLVDQLQDQDQDQDQDQQAAARLATRLADSAQVCAALETVCGAVWGSDRRRHAVRQLLELAEAVRRTPDGGAVRLDAAAKRTARHLAQHTDLLARLFDDDALRGRLVPDRLAGRLFAVALCLDGLRGDLEQDTQAPAEQAAPLTAKALLSDPAIRQAMQELEQAEAAADAAGDHPGTQASKKAAKQEREAAKQRRSAALRKILRQVKQKRQDQQHGFGAAAARPAGTQATGQARFPADASGLMGVLEALDALEVLDQAAIEAFSERHRVAQDTTPAAPTPHRPIRSTAADKQLRMKPTALSVAEEVYHTTAQAQQPGALPTGSPAHPWSTAMTSTMPHHPSGALRGETAPTERDLSDTGGWIEENERAAAAIMEGRRVSVMRKVLSRANFP